MKKMFIIRHAKSSWDDPYLDDFDRPLNKRGERDAPNMGKRLKEKGIHPDLMLSSPANRALTTCTVMANILGYPKEKIQTDQNLYHADEDEILEILRELPGYVNTLLVFGHNPGLTEFVNSLTDARIRNIPTCGIAECELKIDAWKDLKWNCGKVVVFDYPKKQ